MSRHHRYTRPFLIVVSLVFLFQAACGAVKLAPTFSHQGRLLDGSGNVVPDGTYEVEYRIFHAATEGTAAYTETQNVQVVDGLFTTSISPLGTIDPTVFARPTWLELAINGETLTPRQRLQGSPYAFSLISGAVVQGAQTIDREYVGETDTGATLTVWNTDSSATGGNGLLAINAANPTTAAAREKTAALQARALGETYGAIVTSQDFRALYAKSAPGCYDAYFMGDVGIYVNGSCTGCTMAYTAQNVGSAPIQAGDFVAVEGVMTDPDLNVPVMLVRVATGPGDAIIGVATGAMTRRPVGESSGVVTGGFDPAEGAAAANGYLSVAVSGLVQARAADTGLQPGASVTAGPDGAETAAGNGFTRALSSVDANGMVWVMLGGQ